MRRLFISAAVLFLSIPVVYYRLNLSDELIAFDRVKLLRGAANCELVRLFALLNKERDTVGVLPTKINELFIAEVSELFIAEVSELFIVEELENTAFV